MYVACAENVKGLVKLFAALLKQQSQDGGGQHAAPVAYLATTLRNPETYALFMRLADAHGLQLEDCSGAMRSCSVRFLDRPQAESREQVVLTRIGLRQGGDV